MSKTRLAEPGFYVEYYGKQQYTFVENSKDPTETFGVTYISPEGKCQYIHWMDPAADWYTLLWTCAPTKKKIEKAAKAKPDTIIERYIYFPTHDELCKFPFIHYKPKALLAP